jgi:hypothetical protein
MRYNKAWIKRNEMTCSLSNSLCHWLASDTNYLKSQLQIGWLIFIGEGVIKYISNNIKPTLYTSIASL